MKEEGPHSEQVLEFVYQALQDVCKRGAVSHAESECTLHGHRAAIMVMPAVIADAVRAALIDIMAPRRN